MRGHLGFKVSRVQPCLTEQVDYFFEYVKLLLNFEEMSTAAAPYCIVDNSPDARQVELTATAPNPIVAAFETAPQKKFGEKSIRLADGVTATVVAAAGKDFSLTRPCVVEFWLRASTTTTVNKAKILGTDGWGFFLDMAADPNKRILEFVVFERAVRLAINGIDYKIFWRLAVVEELPGFLFIPEAQFNAPETSAWWGNENAAQTFAAAYASYLTANNLPTDVRVKFVWNIVTNIVTEFFGGVEYTDTYRQLKYYYVDETLNVVADEENFATLENEGTENERWRASTSTLRFATSSRPNDYPGEENGHVQRRNEITFNPQTWVYVQFIRFPNSTFTRFNIGSNMFGPTLNTVDVFSDYGTPLTIGYAGENSGAYVDDVRVTIGSSRDYPVPSIAPICSFAITGSEQDALFEYVELLLHLNGVYSSPASVADSSTRDRTVSSVGVVQQFPNGYGRFGGAVAFGPFYGGYLSIPYAAAWDLNTGPFALEFWLSLRTFFSSGTKIIGTAGWGIFVESAALGGAGPYRLELRSFAENGDLLYSSDCGPVNFDVWTYVYISNTDVRVGTTLGSAPQFFADDKSFNPTAHGSALTIGGDANGTITAYVDEVRITRAARPPPATVPTTPFPNSGPLA